MQFKIKNITTGSDQKIKFDVEILKNAKSNYNGEKIPLSDNEVEINKIFITNKQNAPKTKCHTEYMLSSDADSD